MSWYYAQANESRGPVPEAEFLELVRQGVIQSSTLVWKEGMPQWVTWSSVQSEVLTAAGAQPGAKVVPVPPGHSLCVSCRKAFPEEDLIPLAGRKVCATCKPAQLQRLQEGAVGWTTPGPSIGGGSSGHPHGTLTAEEIEARDYDIPVVELFTAAINAVKAEPAALLLGGILIMVTMWGVQVATVPFQLIPVVGQVFAMFLPSIILGPLIGGLALTYLRHIRGEKVSAGDVFCGFGPRFKKLAIAYFVPASISLIFYIPMIILIGVMGVGTIFPMPGAGAGGAPTFNAPSFTAMMAGIAALAAIGSLVYFYLTVCWIYTVPLVADRNLGFWEAMGLSRRIVSKHFWQHVWFFIFSWIVSVLGFFVCCVGVLVALPLIALAGTMLYERIFHGLEAKPEHAAS